MSDNELNTEEDYADEYAIDADSSTKEYVTFQIEGQLFGIHVMQVQDVLGPQELVRIPLAPREVAGALNLRGRIVTAIDVRMRLGLKAYEGEKPPMSIVVEHDGELYSLLVDKVGEVLKMKEDNFEQNPATLDAVWREVSVGIYRLEEELLLIVDVDKLLDLDSLKAA